MSAKEAEKRNLKTMAKIVSHAITGVKPQIMGIGPISAVQKAVSYIIMYIQYIFI